MSQHDIKWSGPDANYILFLNILQENTKEICIRLQEISAESVSFILELRYSFSLLPAGAI